RQLCSGPARLCQALSIDTRNDRTDLTASDDIWLEESPVVVGQRPWQLTRSPRIGISSAQEKPHRLFIDGHQCVSGLARLHCQKRTWTFGNLRY
ncbi:MAG: DNA-3-methyladenine glycosylase, partial [Pirellulaceae bacterium]|nr:DNA-3-methyladenine glycosylase [Pirellulaceae bacterium]